MNERDDAVYLRHIVDAIGGIQVYLTDVDEPAFRQNTLIQDGVIRQIEIIGEAVRHLSPNLCDRHPGVPWQDLARMRNKLIHDYFGVSLEAVWLTARDDIPELRRQILMILGDPPRS